MKAAPIIWAIDPYQKNPKIWKRSKELATFTSTSLKLKLQPLYVADRSQLTTLGAFNPNEVKEFIKSSEKRLAQLLKTFKSRALLKPLVIFSEDLDLGDEAGLVGKYSKKKKAQLIIAATQARSGLKRLLQGSFAETLVAKSQKPVILANPESRIKGSIKHIVFATDFSLSSRRALTKICESARRAKASLEIVNILEDPMSWAGSTTQRNAAAAAYLRDGLLEKERHRALRRGASWLNYAKKQGVKAFFTLKERASTVAVSSAILKQVNSAKADLVAVAARGDTSKMYFFGSAAQDVIRGSRVPVWVYHGSRD